MDQLILEQLETVNRLNKEVIIMGDFNINYLSNATNLNIKRSFNNLGLTQIIKTATRINEGSSTSVDVIFTNKAANVTNASSFPLSFSDHDMIGCMRKINIIKYNPSYKRLLNRCNTLIRKSKSSYQRNLLTEKETNPHQFWNAIKEIYPTKPKPVGSVTTRTIECCDYKHNHNDLCNDIKDINWKPIEEASDIN